MKNRNKLDKINVPELFYAQFLANVVRGVSSVVDKLHDTAPTARGRGQSRVITDLTESEWDDLYQRAAAAREKMKGADREVELRPAICAKALADRMEKLGVTNPVTYVPSKTRTRKASVADSSDIPASPLAVQPSVDENEEADETDLSSMVEDLGLNDSASG